MEQNGYESIKCWTRYVSLKFDLTHNLDLGPIYGMEGLIDMERKGCESIGYGTHYDILNCDFELENMKVTF